MARLVSPRQDGVAMQRLPKIEGASAEPIRVAAFAPTVGPSKRTPNTISLLAHTDTAA